MFEIQFDDEAQHQAAFVGATARDRDAYLKRWHDFLKDDSIGTKVIELDGETVGSVGTFPIEGDIELTYWIRKDVWGRGVATAAVAALLDEVETRPLHARVVEDNAGSIRVLERNGFVRIGSEEAFAEGRQATVTELIYVLND
jgi:RimJ/RimL family protein N-acetyltransferase